jgi:hypothetical protein
VDEVRVVWKTGRGERKDARYIDKKLEIDKKKAEGPMWWGVGGWGLEA